MAKIRRDQLVRPTSDATYEQLAEAAKSTKVLTKEPKALKLADIHVAPNVFQWRRRGRNLEPSDMHILELARGLQDGGTVLPPLLVHLIGERFYVVDGHHRLAAYHSVGWKKVVPVIVFSGTLEEACTRALRLNSRNKLMMTREDKGEAAWKLTKTKPHLSKAAVHELSTVSTGTIASMRRTWRQLCELASSEEGRVQLGGHDIEDMREALTWTRARMLLEGVNLPKDRDWMETETEKLTQLLTDHVGFKLMRHPDVTAEALRRLNPELPRALIYEWALEERETIKELAAVEEIEF